jgi:hypothetical protein
LSLRRPQRELVIQVASDLSGCVWYAVCSHLGSNAVAFSHGSHGNTVSYSQFRDISASAVAIGTRDNPTNKTDPSVQDLDNTVSDCTVSHAAIEFRGHPALLVGFSRGTTLEHNELSHLRASTRLGSCLARLGSCVAVAG